MNRIYEDLDHQMKTRATEQRQRRATLKSKFTRTLLNDALIELQAAQDGGMKIDMEYISAYVSPRSLQIYATVHDVENLKDMKLALLLERLDSMRKKVEAKTRDYVSDSGATAYREFSFVWRQSEKWNARTVSLELTAYLCDEAKRKCRFEPVGEPRTVTVQDHRIVCDEA